MFSMLVASCSNSLPEEYRIENVRRRRSNNEFMSSEKVLGLCCVAVVSNVCKKLSYSWMVCLLVFVDSKICLMVLMYVMRDLVPNAWRICVMAVWGEL